MLTCNFGQYLNDTVTNHAEISGRCAVTDSAHGTVNTFHPCNASIYYQCSWCIVRNSFHYNDVIMSAIVSETIGVSIVYSAVCSGADRRKHQSSASLAFVRTYNRHNLWGEFNDDRCYHLMTLSCKWRTIQNQPFIITPSADALAPNDTTSLYDFLKLKQLHVNSFAVSLVTFICVLIQN